LEVRIAGLLDEIAQNFAQFGERWQIGNEKCDQEHPGLHRIPILEEEHHEIFDSDPVAFAEPRLNPQPDPQQVEIIRLTAPEMILCIGRQCGESTIIAIQGCHHPTEDCLCYCNRRR
jgi:hypothetical protein